MEAFKAVEKEMKTKAFSKEGLSLAAKLDPREQEKDEIVSFLTDAIGSLGHQVEEHEAEIGDIKAKLKKAKKGGNADNQSRMTSLETSVEQNKMHQGKLELLLRGVENDSIEAQRVKDELQEQIQEYVDNNQEADFDPDAYEFIYEDFGLDEEEAHYGVPLDAADKSISHEDSSVGEPLEPTASNEEGGQKQRNKSKSGVDISAPHRRPSQQIKSPLPTLATLHTQPPPPAPPVSKDMKPAPPPKPAGEPLRYASAAAAATATDKAGIGIAPLPPPNVLNAAVQSPASSSLAPHHTEPSVKSSATTSPAVTTAAPTDSARSVAPGAGVADKKTVSTMSPAVSSASVSVQSPPQGSAQLVESSTRDEPVTSIPPSTTPSRPPGLPALDHDRSLRSDGLKTNGIEHAVEDSEPEEEESIYHLPESLRDLVSTYETARAANANLSASSPEAQRLLNQSYMTRPDANDAERPSHYRPNNLAAYTPPHYPQDPSPIFNNPRLYDRIDTDSLFYSFYYRQGSYQQYLAAKALKGNSWRFHKQYQTWFQRHEEPKTITEDYEQGTYRFFDYESTW